MHRLRNLDGRARLVALLAVVCLTAPFVASVVGAVHRDWTPSNDEALIALRVHDVTSGHPPLIGQPSTAAQYSELDPPHHPGPIEFYLLVPAVELLGSDLGMLVGAGLFNLSAILVAAWVVFRRAGPLVGLAGVLALSGLAWAQGIAMLTDPISSNMGGIPLVAVVVLGWAVLDGDLRLLPLFALALAFVCQQHLAVVGVAAGTAAWVAVGLAFTWLGWRRAAGDPEGGGAGPPQDRWWWLGGAAAVSLVAWLPVIIDQVAGTGNVGRMLSFGGADDRPSLGLGAGIRQGLRALGVPPLVLRTNLHGDAIHAPLSGPAIAGTLVVIGLLVAIAVADRHRCRPRASLAITTLVLAACGALTGANVPRSMEADRINFYRWAFVASALAWFVLAWAAAGLVRRRWPAETARIQVPGAIAIGLAVVLVAGATVAWSGPRDRRDQEVFHTERRLADVADEALEPGSRVLLVPDGSAASLALVPALTLQLVERGHAVRVPSDQVAGYGDHLVDHGEPFDAGLVLVTGKDRVPDGPGRVLARVDLNASNRAARARLAEQLKGKDLHVSPDGPAIIEDVAGDTLVGRSAIFGLLLASVSKDPARALEYPDVARALDAGYFDQIDLDPEALATLRAHPVRYSWAQDVFELRLLTPDELRAAYPDRVG